MTKEIDYARARMLLPLLGQDGHDLDWLAQQLCGGGVSNPADLAACAGTYEYADHEKLVLSPEGVYTVEIYSSDGATARYAGTYRVTREEGQRVVETVDVNTAALRDFASSAGSDSRPIFLEPQDAVTTPAEGRADILTFTKDDGTVHVFHRT